MVNQNLIPEIKEEKKGWACGMPIILALGRLRREERV
jgi:hypothetical protein